MSRAIEGNIGGTPVQPLLNEFLRHLLDFRGCSERTVQSYRKDAEAFIGFLNSEGITTVEGVARQHAHRFAARLAHLASATICRRIYALRSWFGYMVNVGLIETNPLASIELPKRKSRLPKVPSKEQCDALLAACETPCEEVIIALLLMGGLRKSELLNLNVEDVSVGCDQIRVMGKGGKERIIPLCDFAQQVLRRHLEQHDNEGPALIANECGRRIGSTTFYRIFRRLLARAGLDGAGLTPHSLRHAFGTLLIRNGVDVATVCELMGHSNISVTSVYLHADTTSKQEAVARLPWAHSGEAKHQESDETDR